jgi:hypothetical protein
VKSVSNYLLLEEKNGAVSAVPYGVLSFFPGRRSVPYGVASFFPGRRSVPYGVLSFFPGRRSVAYGHLTREKIIYSTEVSLQIEK